ncbi:ABC transporter permease [Myxococcota bacterium]|nr:ABC transporter permease [Myxococcota bacterium]
MGPLLAIASNTYREAIRNKVLYSIVLFALLIILVGNFLADISLHNDKRVLFDVGIGLLSTFGLILSVFTGTSLIYKEIDRKTIYLILTKPVGRAQFLFGKMLGLVGSVYLVLALMFVLLVAQSAIMGSGFHPNLFKAVLLIFFEVIIIISITTLFSSFSTPFITGMLTFGIIVIGRLLPDLKQIIIVKYQADSMRELADRLLQVFPQLYLFVPNGHDFNGQYVSITAEFVTWGYIGWTALYAIMYSAIILLIAAMVFRRRDLT